MKIKYVILLITIYVVAYVSINYNLNLFYPYYVIKDYLLYPVNALINDQDLSFDKNYYESIISSLQDDINKLKELTKIDNVLTDYKYLPATIIGRNRDYWFNTITINKGKIDGIDLDMAVVDGNGLIGRISNVRKNTSDIKLITTNDVNSKISVVIKNQEKDIYGIITGYDYENELLKVTIIEKNEVTENDKVETTGMGGVFPKGILVGNVYDKKIDEDGVSIIVRVKLSGNIKGDNYVAVLQRNEMGS